MLSFGRLPAKNETSWTRQTVSFMTLPSYCPLGERRRKDGVTLVHSTRGHLGLYLSLAT